MVYGGYISKLKGCHIICLKRVFLKNVFEGLCDIYIERC